MDLAEKYGIDLGQVGKTACPRCRRKGEDTSGNNLHVYGYEQGAHCWSCGWTIPSLEHREAMGWDEDEQEEDEVVTREAITEEENKRIKKQTTTDGRDWRGIRRETNRFFGVLYEIDPETGEPCKQLVPTTIDYKLVGYRVRKFPKDFSEPIGKVGKECDMIFEHRFKNHTKTCIISGGETKALTTYQLLDDDRQRRGKGEYESTAVVCSTLGESGAWKQVQARYKFFDQFEKVIICMDDDEAGREATEKIAKVLPKGKAFVMKMRYKDADEYVKAGAEREFITDFWKALDNPWVPAGIVGSGDLGEKMLAEAALEKVPFPPFMKELNELTAGGIGLGRIVNIGAGSGIGKTTIVDTMLYDWIYTSPHLVGIVSMELNAGQYGISMLSRHIRRKIENIKDKDEKIRFMQEEWVQKAQKELFFKPDGTHRFFLVDDRDGSLEDLKAVVEELVIRCGVKVVVLDPLQDILEGLKEDEQGLFMKWQKGLCKSHNVTFININHIRKSGNGQQANSNGRMISEEDFHGSSTIFKSASLNILLVRDKMNEDPIIRNTTFIYVSKNRVNGATGPGGCFVYDNETHQLMSLEEWQAKQPAATY